MNSFPSSHPWLQLGLGEMSLVFGPACRSRVSLSPKGRAKSFLVGSVVGCERGKPESWQWALAVGRLTCPKRLPLSHGARAPQGYCGTTAVGLSSLLGKWLTLSHQLAKVSPTLTDNLKLDRLSRSASSVGFSCLPHLSGCSFSSFCWVTS